MNAYIILTYPIYKLGGSQAYTLGKAQYLEKNGWKVFVMSYGIRLKGCKYKELDKYVDGCFSNLYFAPYHLTSRDMNRTLNRMVNYINNRIDLQNTTIYIESQTDITALWGEMLAEKLRAKHVIFTVNESYRGNRLYDENLDFFNFKYENKELLGSDERSLSLLFENYRQIDIKNQPLFIPLEPNPVRDVEYRIVNNIKKRDKNVCYIGRPEKGYLPFIATALNEITKRYDESYNFIIVGNKNIAKREIGNKLSSNRNVKVIYCNELIPIPKLLYTKVDVVFASSTCADFSALQRVPTIVCERLVKNKSSGILGYTTKDPLDVGSNGYFEYIDVLEDVLYTKNFKSIQYSYHEEYNNEEEYKKQLNFFESPTNGFFTIINSKSKKKSIIKVKMLPLFLLLSRIFKME